MTKLLFSAQELGYSVGDCAFAQPQAAEFRLGA